MIPLDVERESTLENFKGYSASRKTGTTTRLIDHAIQIIFNGKACVVRDHHMYGRNRQANNDLCFRILRRMEFEHHISSKDLIVDPNTPTIYLPRR